MAHICKVRSPDSVPKAELPTSKLQSYHQYIKISLCVCVTEVGRSWGGTRLVTHSLHTYYTLYCTCVWLQTDATGILQLDKANACWRAAAETMQSGGSLVWPHETSGRQRRYCILRLLVHQGSYTGLTQTWSKRRDLWSIPSYVCREERVLMCAALC